MKLPFIARTFKYPTIYDGTIKNGHSYVDPGSVHTRYKYWSTILKNPKFENLFPDIDLDPDSPHSPKFFQEPIIEYNDKAQPVKIPVRPFTIEPTSDTASNTTSNTTSDTASIDKITYIDHTDEARTELAALARKRIIDDIVFGLMLKILRKYSLVKISAFPDQFIFIPSVTPKIPVSQSASGIILSMKEYIDGLIFPDPLYFIDDQANEKVETISKDWELPNPFYKKEIPATTLQSYFPMTSPKRSPPESYALSEHQTIIVPNNYTINLRNALFGQQALINYKNKTLTSVKLMQDRQYDSEIREGRISIIGGVRRVGKTFKLIYNALKKIMKPNFRSIFQPTTVLYVGLSRKSLRQPIIYLLYMIKQFGPMGKQMFHWDAQNMIFTFKADTAGYGDPQTVGQIMFISAKEDDPGVGLGADHIIFDEMAKLPRKVIEDIMPIVTHQGASLLGASTNYYDEPMGLFHELMQEAESKQSKYEDINRVIATQFQETVLAAKAYDKDPFAELPKTISDSSNLSSDLSSLTKPHDVEDDFERLVAEMGLQQLNQSIQQFKFKKQVFTPEPKRLNFEVADMAGMRYTIDDAEFIPVAEKEAIKRRYEHNPARYNAELYCRFAGDNQCFNYAGRIVNHAELMPLPGSPSSIKYDVLVAAYDPALTKDTSGFVLLGYSKERRQISCIEERRLTKDGTYAFQFRQIKELLMYWSRTYGLKAAQETFHTDSPGNKAGLPTNSVPFTSIILPPGFHCVMDGTDKGLAEYLQSQGIPILYQFAYTAGQKIRDGIISKEFLLPKEILVKVAKNVFDNGFVKISEMCTNLQREFDTFKAHFTNAGNVVFEAESGKGKDGQKNYDDLTNCFMLGTLTIVHSWESIQNKRREGLGYSKELYVDKEIREEIVKELQNNYSVLEYQAKIAERSKTINSYYEKYKY